ncbi:MAG: hypothetical protein V4642_03865 [Bacteroidota bacterium]
MKLLLFRRIWLLSLLFIAVIGCRDTTQSDPVPFKAIQQPEFVIPPVYAQSQYQIVRADLDNNGYEDILVLLSNRPAGERGFDSLFVFQYDTTAKSFNKTFGSYFDRGQRIEVSSITDDLQPDILVYTDAGGTSATASRGLTILSPGPSGLNVLRTFSDGRPRVVQLGEDSTLAVSLLTNYGNILLKSQEVPYVDSLLFFKKLDPDRERALKSEFLRAELTKTDEEYTGAKTSLKLKKNDATIFRVYSTAVQKILYYRMLGDMSAMNTWFQQEQQFWQENFSSDYMDMINDAKEEKISL